LFDNKTLLITGGTGSFGNAVMERFLDTDIKEIRIFSRDEKKQDDMEGFYRVPADNRDLNYGKYFENGDKNLSDDDEYNSHNTERLTIEQIKEKLLELPYIQQELRGWNLK